MGKGPHDIIWPAVGKARRNHNTRAYLDAVKRRLGIESDYALAKHLGISKASVSLLMSGGNVMSNTTAAKVSEILELDLRVVIADCELERGSPEDLWKRIKDKVTAVVPLLLVGISSLSSEHVAAALRGIGALLVLVALYVVGMELAGVEDALGAFVPVAFAALNGNTHCGA